MNREAYHPAPGVSTGFGGCDPPETDPDRVTDLTPNLGDLTWEGGRAFTLEVARRRPRGDRRARVRGLVLLPEDRSRAPGRDQEPARCPREQRRGRCQSQHRCL